MRTTNRFQKSQYDALNRKRANEARERQYELFRRTLESFTGCHVVAEHKFHYTRKWRIDFAIIDLKIGIEIEGGVWSGGAHTRGKGFIEDMEKYNAAAMLGYTVLRFSTADVKSGKAIEQIKGMVNDA